MSDPRALLGRGRSARHAARHGSRRQPSWAHRRTSALGGWGGDEYTTLGAQSMPRHRHRQTPQVYVFPDEPEPPAAAQGEAQAEAEAQAGVQAEAGPQAQGLQAEEEEEADEKEDRREAPAEPQPRARGAAPTTTRLPYPDERPFYFRHDPQEESQWEHLRGLGPVTIEGQSPAQEDANWSWHPHPRGTRAALTPHPRRNHTGVAPQTAP